MAFSAGILIAAALLDLLPDAFDVAGRAGGSSTRHVLLGAALGFLVFYGLDRFVHLTAAGHEEAGGSHGAEAFGAVAALGLVVHSFLDGFAIGSAFRADQAVGILVAAAVIAHDFGDGVSTVSLVLSSRRGVRASLGWLLADALAPLVGSAVALAIALPTGALADLLGFFAGSFLFIGGSHLLPEAQQEHHDWWLPAAVLAGFVLIFVATQVLG